MKRNPTARRVRNRIGEDDTFRTWVSLFMKSKRYGGVYRVRKLAKNLYQEIIRRRTKNESQRSN